MSLFVRIVAGEAAFGPLPDSAVRLDTLEPVNLETSPEWARACGYFDVDTVTLADMPAGLTAEQREAIIAAVVSARGRRERRHQFVENLRDNAGAFKSQAWDWLDRFGSPPVPGSPNAGADWGPLTQANRGERLRDGETWAFRGLIQLVDVVMLMIDALTPLLDAADFEPPDPR